MLLSSGASLAAQAPATPPPAPGTVNVEADPIRCWWRTSASAVRVGEPFSLLLTCAVVENETTTIVPDQSRLDPAAMQLPPFEVVGGQREPDLRSDQRRFFQYQYSLRLINEEAFGRDVRIPSIQINYHVESRMARGEAVRGRDRTYILPTESVRVLSLVPADAVDIRDAPSWTFGDIDAQRFRARALFLTGGVLFTAAALVVLVALLRAARRYRREGAVGRALLTDNAILRGVGRELAAVRRASEAGGWNADLAARALAALRVAGTLALGRRVSQTRAGATGNGHGGQLAVRSGFGLGKKVLVSGSATTGNIAYALSHHPGSSGHREALEALKTALARFTTALFGRDVKLDDSALTESINDSPRILRRLKLEHLWIVEKLKSMRRPGVDVKSQAFSR